MLTLKCWPEMDYKHTCDTIFTHFQGITNNICGFGRPFFAPSFFYPSTIFLPVHIRFYPSKWQVDGSLHKAMCAPLNKSLIRSHTPHQITLFTAKSHTGHQLLTPSHTSWAPGVIPFTRSHTPCFLPLTESHIPHKEAHTSPRITHLTKVLSLADGTEKWQCRHSSKLWVLRINK